jgi:LuxR family transcriptional regulator, quorum-sensing system regulator BjaR1
MNRSLDEAIGLIEGATALSELSAVLQRIAEDCGFASYAFVDISLAGDQNPLVVMTNRPEWDETYRKENFLEVDPAVTKAFRSNTPFCWSDLPRPERRGKRLPGALKTLFAARDHGYQNGVVIPFHYVDRLGRPYSSVCTFFWTDPISGFFYSLKLNRNYLHLILIYWAQRTIDLAAKSQQLPYRFLDETGSPLAGISLTDREREVLSWAARGKTAGETADIIQISESTAVVHLKHAIAKMGAATKTEACVRAIYLGLINI